jgi:hypothetical protein
VAEEAASEVLSDDAQSLHNVPVTILTSHDFEQDAAGAMKAAAEGPVVIIDGGVPSHVLLSYDQYLEMNGEAADIVTRLSMDEVADIDFDPPKASITAKLGDFC